jgi:hypothetical protein
MKSATATQAKRVRTCRQNRTRKAIEAILRPWWDFQGEYARQLWPFVRDLLRSWQEPKVSLQDIQQALYEREGARVANATVAKMHCDSLLSLCQTLHQYPFEVVKAVLDDQCTLLERGKQDLEELAGMKREIRTIFDGLTDREQFLLGSVAFHESRSESTAFWNEIAGRFTNLELLEKKAAALKDDPRLGPLVHAFHLGKIAYAAYAESE